MKCSLIFICSAFLLSGCSIATIQNGDKKVTITTGTDGRGFLEVTDGAKTVTVNGDKNTVDVRVPDGAGNGSVTVIESDTVNGSWADIVVKDGSGKTVKISY